MGLARGRAGRRTSRGRRAVGARRPRALRGLRRRHSMPSLYMVFRAECPAPRRRHARGSTIRRPRAASPRQRREAPFGVPRPASLRPFGARAPSNLLRRRRCAQKTPRPRLRAMWCAATRRARTRAALAPAAPEGLEQGEKTARLPATRCRVLPGFGP